MSVSVIYLRSSTGTVGRHLDCPYLQGHDQAIVMREFTCVLSDCHRRVHVPWPSVSSNQVGMMLTRGMVEDVGEDCRTRTL